MRASTLQNSDNSRLVYLVTKNQRIIQHIHVTQRSGDLDQSCRRDYPSWSRTARSNAWLERGNCDTIAYEEDGQEQEGGDGRSSTNAKAMAASTPLID